jgi:hypothetical protein
MMLDHIILENSKSIADNFVSFFKLVHAPYPSLYETTESGELATSQLPSIKLTVKDECKHAMKNMNLKIQSSLIGIRYHVLQECSEVLTYLYVHYRISY